jgi:N-acetylmuramate 1-kinase
MNAVLPDTRIDRFLADAGWSRAQATPLAGDASDRRYLRLTRDGATAILMDTPQGSPDNPVAFARIAQHLTALGLSAPKVLADGAADGLLLLEDLGDATYPRHLAQCPADQAGLFAAAVDALAVLQAADLPADLPITTHKAWATAADEGVGWYLTLQGLPPVSVAVALAEALDRHAAGPQVMVMRDFHAENLIWLPDRQGPARAGLLDFQLAQTGPVTYDLVSLIQDARRDVPEDIRDLCMQRLADRSGLPLDALRREAMAVGAQRALRILGVFTRLAHQRGKTVYLAHMPRVWRDLQANLRAPHLADLARACATLPAPQVAT